MHVSPCESLYRLISSLFWLAALRFPTFSTLTSKKQVPPLVFYPTLSPRRVLGRRSLTLVVFRTPSSFFSSPSFFSSLLSLVGKRCPRFLTAGESLSEREGDGQTGGGGQRDEWPHSQAQGTNKNTTIQSNTSTLSMISCLLDDCYTVVL